uniref:Uncharacterized protein n=1 Tax=viral metagenome TaxID=1070528 RepID=A0A6M3XHZ8_9ZZZZ
MFKTHQQKLKKMLHWLRTRGWFDFNIGELKVEEILPHIVGKKLLDIFEEKEIETTSYWPKETNEFWNMFQPVKKYIESMVGIKKAIETLEKRQERLEAEIALKFIKEGGK